CTEVVMNTIHDISNGQEPYPVSLVCDNINELEESKREHQKYVRHSILSNGTPLPPYYDGCDCTDNCQSENCGCKATHGFFYDSQSLRTLNPIFLSPSRNLPAHSTPRLTQRGLTTPLEVFSTGARGWGVRAVEKIVKGQFVCEYAGEIINTEKARTIWKTNTEGKKKNYIFCLREILHDRIQRTNIDATTFGNVARYFNHSCEPNMQIHIIRVDSIIPVIGFFANRDVLPGEELCFDYGGEGYVRDVQERMKEETKNKNVALTKCLCGSEK
ncbi:2948_t:CDS:2, partial [Paraglomus occultum]